MIDHSHQQRMRRMASGLWVPEGRAAGGEHRPGGGGSEGDSGRGPDRPEDRNAAASGRMDEVPPDSGSDADPDANLDADFSPPSATASAATDEAREYRENWLRVLADFENLRRRAARETAEARDRGRAEVLTSLLAVRDDVDRALEAAGGADEATADPIVTGVRLMRTHLEQILRTHGMEEILALGEPFDPHVHEAVMQVPAEEFPPGHVAQVLRRGYRMGDRVLRPARVAVARMPAE
jgi:molecular chaperone GrpE